MQEEWREFDGIRVSNMGRVETKRKGIHFGHIDGGGYRLVDVARKRVQVHRLVAHLFLGLDLTDTKRHVNHIDCDQTNNRVENLELVSHRENHQRRKSHIGGRLVGASFHKQTGKWESKIQINGKRKSLGYFPTEQEAHDAYVKAASML